MNTEKSSAGPERAVAITNSWMNFGEKKAAFDYVEDMILFFALLPMLFVLPVLMSEPRAAFWAAAALPADFVLLTAIRHHAKHWWSFGLEVLAATAVFGAVFVLLHALTESILSIAAALICIQKLRGAVAQRKRAKEDNMTDEPMVSYLGSGTVIFSFIVSLLVYFFSFANSLSPLMACCLCSFVVVCCAMLVYTHFYGESRFSQWEKMSGDPSRPTQNQHSLLFAGLAIVCCCAAAGAAWYVAVLCGASRADAAFFSFWSRIRNKQDAPLNTNADTQSMSMPDALKKLPKSNSSPFLNALGTALQIIFTVLAAVAVVFLAVVGLRALFRLLGRAGNELPEERRSVFPAQRAVKAAGTRLRRSFQDLGLFARGSNRIRIRRMFLAFVRKHPDAAAAQSDAPKDIARRIARGESELDEAAALYERARYGEDECVSADVARMKESLHPSGKQR